MPKILCPNYGHSLKDAVILRELDFNPKQADLQPRTCTSCLASSPKSSER